MSHSEVLGNVGGAYNVEWFACAHRETDDRYHGSLLLERTGHQWECRDKHETRRQALLCALENAATVGLTNDAVYLPERDWDIPFSVPLHPSAPPAAACA